MRTPDSPALKELKQQRRYYTSLLRSFGGLDNAWVTGMFRRCEDRITALTWQVEQERTAWRKAKQRRADAKRRGAPEWRDY